ncbi:MAG: hypothetical protein A2Y25_00130 [Candidatus Melainabacteria bacterium GWF2_37_15]|nr:MAG: hypothetical protein A2Y25_00130 [Candidatus Melainabacteria bacterium GWF2_37_15]
MTIPAVTGLSRAPYQPSFKGAIFIRQEDFNGLLIKRKPEDPIKEPIPFKDFFMKGINDGISRGIVRTCVQTEYKMGIHFNKEQKIEEKKVLQSCKDVGIDALHIESELSPERFQALLK